MLGNTDAVASLAVKDLQAARRFYEEVIGLTPVATQGIELVTFKSGHTLLNVYRSQHAGTNQATAVTWAVGDQLDTIVRGLRSKGVSFEHYSLPDTQLEGDVHVMGRMRVAWFKDPDGNILNLINR